MSSKAIITIVVIALIFAATFVFTYYFYEKPNQEAVAAMPQHNLSIAFFDEETRQQLVAEYIIVVNNEVIKVGKSLSEGYIRERVRINDSFYIYSINGSNKYYNTQYIYTGIESNVSRNIKIDIDLIQVGSLDAVQLSDLDKIKTLRLSSNGTIKSMFVCIYWSSNLLSASMLNYTRVDVPDFLITKANKCYDTKEFLKRSSIDLMFDYRVINSWTSQDFIRVYVFDRDITINSIKNCPSDCYVIRDDDEYDMGAQDFIFELK